MLHAMFRDASHSTLALFGFSQDSIGLFAILPEEIPILCVPDGSLRMALKLGSTNKVLKDILVKGSHANPLRALLPNITTANRARKTGFAIGEVVWPAHMCTNQLRWVLIYLRCVHTIWISPFPVQTDLHAPPVRGEEYVRKLIHAMIPAYGTRIVFDMFERGIKVKPRPVVVF